MTDAANLDGVGIWADEEEAVVAYAQPKFVSPWTAFTLPTPDCAKRRSAEKMCIATGLLSLRTSFLAGSVQTIRFTSVPDSCRSPLE
jgi:hypothetical protein